MLGSIEALVLITILIVQGVRNLFKLPSMSLPYLVFIVAWCVSFVAHVGDYGWTLMAANAALSQCLIIGASAIVLYDVGVKPLKKLVNQTTEKMHR